MKNHKYFFIIIHSLALCLYGYTSKAYDKTDSLWVEYNHTHDVSKRVALLADLSARLFDCGNLERRDSFFSKAVGEEQGRISDTMLFTIYRLYFSLDEYEYPAMSESWVKDMTFLAKRNSNYEWEFFAYRSKAIVILNSSRRNNQDVLDNINQAYYYATLSGVDAIRCQALLELGYCMEKTNDKMSAFRYYTDGYYLAQKIGDDDLLFKFNGKLANFYYFIDNDNNARLFRMKQILQILSRPYIDSLKFMNVRYELGRIDYDAKRYEEGNAIMIEVYSYAFRSHIKSLSNKALDSYRTSLINTGRYQELYELYTCKYPQEWADIQKHDTTTCYRLMAFFAEIRGNSDSAQYWFRIAEPRVLQSSENAFIANYLKRYGEFFLRLSRLDSARLKFEEALQYAQMAHYFPYAIDMTHYLDSICYLQKDFQAAYTYSKLNHSYIDSQANSVKQDELLQLEIENEKRDKDLALQKEKEQKERRQSLEDIAIIMVILLLFIGLILLGAFKVHRLLIQTVGFISFILLFEFIVMISENKVEVYTEGEPWKVLMFKLVLIGILTPIHHNLEHWLIHYLREHRLAVHGKTTLRNLLNGLRARWLAALQEGQNGHTAEHNGAHSVVPHPDDHHGEHARPAEHSHHAEPDHQVPKTDS
jgi:hypothetical protein